jgi:hypothetical protein
VSGDYVKRLRALLMREPGIFSIQEERALRAALGELEQLRAPACPCGGQGTASRLAERDTATAACICGCGRPDDDTGMCHCPTPCPCEPDCAFCLAPNSVRNAERKAADDA